MKVAVPSFQHSKMLGQPASSHTVTSESEPIVFLTERKSSPIRAGTRSHGGLRTATGMPADGSTPACRSRRMGARSSGVETRATGWPVRLGMVTARSSTPEAPHTATARSTSASTVSAIESACPDAASDVTGRSLMPHGTIWANIERSQSTFRATPWSVRRRPSPTRTVRTPTAATLAGSAEPGSSQMPG